ncbi:MAG TPA: alcohol dehydrogenase catalytic domain-containing protein [archaeon]|nr:alcohol dehydrogenase catalytic domain-containing protein [archaeon]
MRALLFDGFGNTPYIADLPVPPISTVDQVVIKVAATGLCRSDWHAWMGHDSSITDFPHLPGHEFAGTVHAIGSAIRKVKVGDRVTVPFVCGCGLCQECLSGNAQVCPNQWQPGFSGPGSFAEYVAIPHADFNVVAIPESMSFEIAASLGCRFATAYRGLNLIHPPLLGESVAIFGCGGIGLAAIMVAKSRGAQVIAVDISEEALTFAKAIGADYSINAQKEDPVARVKSITRFGAHISVDALGSIATAQQSIQSLRPHGHHLQIGLLPIPVIKDRATIPMHIAIGRELHIHGVHGMSSMDYPAMLEDIESGLLHPEKLIGVTIPLDKAPHALMSMDKNYNTGITIIKP